MKRKGDFSDTELEKAMKRLNEAVLALETAGADIFGIISRFEENGVSVTTVSRPADDVYWQKISYALGTRIADNNQDDSETARLVTSLVSAICFAAANSDIFKDLLRDIIIPRLEAAAEDKKLKVKTIKNGGIVS